MKTFKKIYYYAFYRFYRFFEAAPSIWLSDFKAGLMIIALEICLIFSILGYFELYTNTQIIPRNPIKSYFTPVFAILVFINYYYFIRNNDWKSYVKEFDKLPNNKQLKGKLIFWIVVLVIISSLIFMFYLMSLNPPVKDLGYLGFVI
jgi:hypothetical protein